jgi:hypothetical protein
VSSPAAPCRPRLRPRPSATVVAEIATLGIGEAGTSRSSAHREEHRKLALLWLIAFCATSSGVLLLIMLFTVSTIVPLHPHWLTERPAGRCRTSARCLSPHHALAQCAATADPKFERRPACPASKRVPEACVLTESERAGDLLDRKIGVAQVPDGMKPRPHEAPATQRGVFTKCCAR